MNDKKRSTFIKGFWRGMSGAVSLFSFYPAPAPACVDITPLRQPIEDSVDAMRADWVQTGRDIDAAIGEHGRTKASAAHPAA